MKIMYSVFLLLIAVVISKSVLAASSCVVCGSVSNTINSSLAANQNDIGIELQSSDVVTQGATYYNDILAPTQWWLTYVGEEVPTGSASSWSYRAIDDYISVAVKAVHPECNLEYYAPFNVPLLINSTCEPLIAEGNRNFTPIRLQAQIKITKKIVNGTYTLNYHYADLGVCQPAGCTSKQAILQQLYINLNIVVPQTCEINSDQVVLIDFGNISVGSFDGIGAGSPATNIPPIVRDIKVSCDNIDTNSGLTLRVQANSVSGNAIVSTNPDVGFSIANDANGNIITPNSVTSVIPFLLDGSRNATVPIRVFPVNITGNLPTEGSVTAEGYLRVDFP